MTVSFDNCKYNSNELAKRFERIADLFAAIYTTAQEPAPVVRMDLATVDDYDAGNICGTSACHGGWAAVLFLPDQVGKERVFYSKGAYRLAEELGFEDEEELMGWASANPGFWGNRAGHCMFDAYPIAFIPEDEWPPLYEEDEDGHDVPVDPADIEDLNDLDCEDWPDITLADIVQHYRGVANRLRAA